MNTVLIIWNIILTIALIRVTIQSSKTVDWLNRELPKLNTYFKRTERRIKALETAERTAAVWKTSAGGEEFTTYDEDVAREWREDGLDVEGPSL